MPARPLGLTSSLGIGLAASLTGGGVAYRYWLPRPHAALASWAAAVAAVVAAKLVSVPETRGDTLLGEPGRTHDAACLAASFALAGAALVVSIAAFSPGRLRSALQGAGIGLGLAALALVGTSQVQRLQATRIGLMLERVQPWASRIELLSRWPAYFVAVGTLLLPGGLVAGLPLWGLVAIHQGASMVLDVNRLIGAPQRPALRVQRLCSPCLLASALGALGGSWFGRWLPRN